MYLPTIPLPVQPAGGSEAPYNVEQLLYAAQAGELEALAAASSESWILSRLFQRLLCIVHDTSQAPWCAMPSHRAAHACDMLLPRDGQEHTLGTP